MANHITPLIKAMTPLAMYKAIVGSSTQGVRQSYTDIPYVPLDFGGIKGQSAVLSQGLALKIVDFKIESVEE